MSARSRPGQNVAGKVSDAEYAGQKASAVLKYLNDEDMIAAANRAATLANVASPAAPT